MASNTSLQTFRSLTYSIRSSCRHTQLVRPFSHCTRALNAAPFVHKKTEPKSVDQLLGNVDRNFTNAGPNHYESAIPPRDGTEVYKNIAAREWDEDDKHKLHVYATKHNTHLCLTQPNRNPLISVSCGNIGFRKAGRGTYDAAYQLAAFLMSRVQDKGLLPQITKLELVYRGFGPGREAVTKAILGAEGKRIRPLIVKLADSTRLKFGGTRSKKPRRLG
jgi:small subunit ribosomal protein S11